MKFRRNLVSFENFASYENFGIFGKIVEFYMILLSVEISRKNKYRKKKFNGVGGFFDFDEFGKRIESAKRKFESNRTQAKTQIWYNLQSRDMKKSCSESVSLSDWLKNVFERPVYKF